MRRLVFALAFLAAASTSARDAIPDLKGTWSGKGKSIVFGTNPHHASALYPEFMARSQPESQNSNAHVERAEGEISASEKPNTVIARQAPEQATDKAKASSDVLREDSETAKRDAQLAKTEIERFERRRSETQCRARAIGNGKKPQQKPKLTRWSPSHMAGSPFRSSFLQLSHMSFS
jgi:hypothetical protein